MKRAFLAGSALVAGMVGCRAGGNAGSSSGVDGGSGAGPMIMLGGDGGSASAAKMVAAMRAEAGNGASAGGAVNQLGIDDADVLKLTNPSSLPEYTGPTGAVEGTIWITGDASPARATQPKSKCPDAAKLYAKLFREGAASEKGARPLADAVVGVNDLPGASTSYLPPRSGSEAATIHGCTLGTRTVAMTFGQRLDVANQGTLLAGPQLKPGGVMALMLAPPKGDPVHLYPPKPGRYLLTDALSSAAIDADVYVFLFPLHTVTPESGHFRIEGVPTGKRRVFAHLPAADVGSTADVDVRAGETTNVDLTLHFDAARAIPAVSAPPPGPVVR